ncbi:MULTISPECIES: hypothetical protein, partial [Bradyrhizobium]|uniref:hypothetical protein n=1 Tax=Bradyrhizobium TaxID=374 RepID=UPI001EDA4878
PGASRPAPKAADRSHGADSGCGHVGKPSGERDSAAASEEHQEDIFDSRYDQEQEVTVNPARAKRGFVLTIKAPNGRSYQIPVPPGTSTSFRHCVKGASQLRRPDGSFGSLWVDVNIVEMNKREEW